MMALSAYNWLNVVAYPMARVTADQINKLPTMSHLRLSLSAIKPETGLMKA